MARHDLGPVVGFPDGDVVIHDVAGKSVGIYNVGGNFHAILNVCPHAQGPICRGKVSGTMMPSEPGQFDYGMENQVLRCPWHGWEFEIESGLPVFGIDKTRRLRKFAVSVEEGRVLVDMPGPG